MDFGDSSVISTIFLGTVKDAYSFQMMDGSADGSIFTAKGTLKVIPGLNQKVAFKITNILSFEDDEAGDLKEIWHLKSIDPKGLKAKGIFADGIFADDL